MMSEKFDKTDLENFFSLLHSAQKSVIHVRQSPSLNNTIEISVSSNNDEIDRPDPLRIPEIIIVICVLLLWCGSIFIFIRHSELLRIRHRDLPYRSTTKPPTTLSHITVVKHPDDTVINSKSPISSTDGLILPTTYLTMHRDQYGETTDAVSLSPMSRKQRHTRSFDLNTSPVIKYSFDEHNDKEQLIDLHRVSLEIKQSFIDLHRKSMSNLSSIPYPTRYSTNDMAKHKPNDDQNVVVKQRRIRESPV